MGRKKYEEKLLVVVNPWPPSGPRHPQFINNVSSWFEIMLRMNNKGMKVEAVYQQKTHHHIIIELAAEAVIDDLLGAHHWSEFLKEPYRSRHQKNISYVYEFNYQSFSHPSQINWHAAIPTYRTIDPAFPIISPYPTPSPAPAARLPYAAALPPQRRLSNNPPKTGQNSNSEVCATEQGNTTQESPHTNTTMVGKRDPYDEEEEAAKMLQSSGLANVEDSCENEHRQPAVQIKTEIVTDVYEPSSELASLFSQYSVRNTGKLDVSRADEGKYRPSSELQAAIADYEARVKQGDDTDLLLGDHKPKLSLLRRDVDESPPPKRIKRE